MMFALHDAVAQPTHSTQRTEHPTRWASLSYVLGNAMLSISAGAESSSIPASPLMRTALTAYHSATLLRLATGWNSDVADTPEDIAKDAFNAAFNSDIAATPQHLQWLQRGLHYLQEHPWQVSSALSFGGAAAHLADIATREVPTKSAGYYEAVTPALGVLATGIILALPEGDDEAVAQTDQSSNTHTLLSKPLALAAGIQSIASAGYAIAAFKTTPPNIPLLGAASAYLCGNLIQAGAKKEHHVNQQHIIHEAAALLVDQAMTNPAAQRNMATALAAHEYVHEPQETILATLNTLVTEALAERNPPTLLQNSWAARMSQTEPLPEPAR